MVSILHAARISLAFQTNKRRMESRLSFTQDMAGFLIMCWGGSLTVAFLLSAPAPQLVSSMPWIVYPAVHLALSSLFHFVPIPDAKFLDTVLPLVDSVVRSFPIVTAIDLVRAHPNPLINESLTAQIVCAAVASAGGSAWASALGVWEIDWRFRTPSLLGAGGLMPSVDAWAGILAGITFGALSGSHPLYAAYGLKYGRRGLLDKPYLSPLEARAAAVAVLTVIFGWRVRRCAQLANHQTLQTHYITTRRQVARKAMRLKDQPNSEGHGAPHEAKKSKKQ